MPLLLTVLETIFVLLVAGDTLINSLRQQSYIYNAKTKILLELLAKECPSFSMATRELPDNKLRLDIEVQRIHYDRLASTLIECRKNKTDQDKPTTESIKTTTATPATTTPTTTTPRCYDSMPTLLKITFVNYSNPFDLKASGLRCDSFPGAAQNDLCDLQFEVCISDIGYR